MTHTYRLAEGETLVLRTDDSPWQTATFAVADFADIGAATADEAAAVIDRLDGIAASANQAGYLVLATEETGEYAQIEVNVAASTAAAALGLAADRAGARGHGIGAARLIGTASEPFALPAHATMTVSVDGRTRKVAFDAAGSADAATVAQVINAKLRRKVARPTAEGRIMLVSPTIGAGSRLSVTPPGDRDIPDASARLGFVGAAAHTDPYPSGQARLVCTPTPDTALVVNLTAVPIELQLPTGRAVLPARGRVAVTRDVAADALLLRLVSQGAVRLSHGSS